MEFFVVLIIVIMLCMILNIGVLRMLIGALLLLGLIVIGMMLLFSYYFLQLLFTRIRKATFVRIDRAERLPFDVAYYQIENEEYPCVFPAEGILRSKLYNKEKTCHVLLHKRMKQVYDRYAMTSCILGTLLSVGVVFVVVGLVQYLFFS